MSCDDRVAEYLVVCGLGADGLQTPYQRRRADSAFDLQPISDIGFVSSAQPVTSEHTVCTGGSINSGFLADDCFVSFSRAAHEQGPLTAIAVVHDINDVPVGFTVTSVVNKARRKVWLCVERRVGRPAVLDVLVVRPEKGQSAPDSSYVVLEPTLNAGAFGEVVQLAYRCANEASVRARYEPQLLDRYPLVDHPDRPFPDAVAQFCFPTGVALRFEMDLPSFFTFVLTDTKGTELYGACLTFYEPQDIDLSAINVQTPVGSVVCAPKAICLLSRWPFYKTFRKFLFHLYRLQLSPSAFPLERFIGHFFSLSLPPSGVSLRYSLLPLSVDHVAAAPVASQEAQSSSASRDQPTRSVNLQPFPDKPRSMNASNVAAAQLQQRNLLAVQVNRRISISRPLSRRSLSGVPSSKSPQASPSTMTPSPVGSLPEYSLPCSAQSTESPQLDSPTEDPWAALVRLEHDSMHPPPHSGADMLIRRMPNFKFPYQDELPLRTLLSCIDLRSVICLINCLLCERKIVLLSSSFSILHQAAEAVRSLLFPLQWKYTYVPVLPSTMTQVLQSFLPFIVGCHGSMCDDTKFPRDVVLVDLDHRQLLGCGLPWPELPTALVQASWSGNISTYHTSNETSFSLSATTATVVSPSIFSYNSMPTFSPPHSFGSAPLLTFPLASPSKSIASSLLYSPCFVSNEDEPESNTDKSKQDDLLTRDSFAHFAAADAAETQSLGIPLFRMPSADVLRLAHRLLPDCMVSFRPREPAPAFSRPIANHHDIDDDDDMSVLLPSGVAPFDQVIASMLDTEHAEDDENRIVSSASAFISAWAGIFSLAPAGATLFPMSSNSVTNTTVEPVATHNPELANAACAIAAAPFAFSDLRVRAAVLELTSRLLSPYRLGLLNKVASAASAQQSDHGWSDMFDSDAFLKHFQEDDAREFARKLCETQGFQSFVSFVWHPPSTVDPNISALSQRNIVFFDSCTAVTDALPVAPSQSFSTLFPTNITRPMSAIINDRLRLLASQLPSTHRLLLMQHWKRLLHEKRSQPNTDFEIDSFKSSALGIGSEHMPFFALLLLLSDVVDASGTGNCEIDVEPAVPGNKLYHYICFPAFTPELFHNVQPSKNDSSSLLTIPKKSYNVHQQTYRMLQHAFHSSTNVKQILRLNSESEVSALSSSFSSQNRLSVAVGALQAALVSTYRVKQANPDALSQLPGPEVLPSPPTMLSRQQQWWSNSMLRTTSRLFWFVRVRLALASAFASVAANQNETLSGQRSALLAALSERAAHGHSSNAASLEPKTQLPSHLLSTQTDIAPFTDHIDDGCDLLDALTQIVMRRLSVKSETDSTLLGAAFPDSLYLSQPSAINQQTAMSVSVHRLSEHTLTEIVPEECWSWILAWLAVRDQCMNAELDGLVQPLAKAESKPHSKADSKEVEQDQSSTPSFYSLFTALQPWLHLSHASGNQANLIHQSASLNSIASCAATFHSRLALMSVPFNRMVLVSQSAETEKAVQELASKVEVAPAVVVSLLSRLGLVDVPSPARTSNPIAPDGCFHSVAAILGEQDWTSPLVHSVHAVRRRMRHGLYSPETLPFALPLHMCTQAICSACEHELSGEDIVAGWCSLDFDQASGEQTDEVKPRQHQSEHQPPPPSPKYVTKCPLCFFEVPVYLRVGFLSMGQKINSSTFASAAASTFGTVHGDSSEQSDSQEWEIEWNLVPLMSPVELERSMRGVFSTQLSPFMISPAALFSECVHGSAKSSNQSASGDVGGLSLLHREPVLFLSLLFHWTSQHMPTRWALGPIARFTSPITSDIVDSDSADLAHVLRWFGSASDVDYVTSVDVPSTNGGDVASALHQVDWMEKANNCDSDWFEFARTSTSRQSPWSLRLRPSALLSALRVRRESLSRAGVIDSQSPVQSSDAVSTLLLLQKCCSVLDARHFYDTLNSEKEQPKNAMNSSNPASHDVLRALHVLLPQRSRYSRRHDEQELSTGKGSSGSMLLKLAPHTLVIDSHAYSFDSSSGDLLTLDRIRDLLRNHKLGDAISTFIRRRADKGEAVNTANAAAAATALKASTPKNRPIVPMTPAQVDTNAIWANMQSAMSESPETARSARRKYSVINSASTPETSDADELLSSDVSIFHMPLFRALLLLRETNSFDVGSAALTSTDSFAQAFAVECGRLDGSVRQYLCPADRAPSADHIRWSRFISRQVHPEVKISFHQQTAASEGCQSCLGIMTHMRSSRSWSPEAVALVNAAASTSLPACCALLKLRLSAFQSRPPIGRLIAASTPVAWASALSSASSRLKLLNWITSKHNHSDLLGAAASSACLEHSKTCVFALEAASAAAAMEARVAASSLSHHSSAVQHIAPVPAPTSAPAPVQSSPRPKSPVTIEANRADIIANARSANELRARLGFGGRRNVAVPPPISVSVQSSTEASADSPAVQIDTAQLFRAPLVHKLRSTHPTALEWDSLASALLFLMHVHQRLVLPLLEFARAHQSDQSQLLTPTPKSASLKFFHSLTDHAAATLASSVAPLSWRVQRHEHCVWIFREFFSKESFACLPWPRSIREHVEKALFHYAPPVSAETKTEPLLGAPLLKSTQSVFSSHAGSSIPPLRSPAITITDHSSGKSHVSVAPQSATIPASTKHIDPHFMGIHLFDSAVTCAHGWLKAHCERPFHFAAWRDAYLTKSHPAESCTPPQSVEPVSEAVVSSPVAVANEPDALEQQIAALSVGAPSGLASEVPNDSLKSILADLESADTDSL